MKIVKRDGKLVEFNKEKIITAIVSSMEETKVVDVGVAEEIADEIKEEVEHFEEFQGKHMTVENIQDLVEDKLMTKDFHKTAKRYILFRENRARERNKEWDMTDLQRDVLYRKYIHSGETFNDFIKRVSNGEPKLEKAIRDRKFLFAGRILDGRGSKDKKTYSNCFVLPSPEDNLESIFEVGKKMARTYSKGGGVGCCLSKLRPNGAITHNSAEKSTGTVSFGGLYSFITGLISQKGRRGALMLTLDVSHPDIKEFITVKSDLDKLTKANISVMITDEFMEAVRESKNFTTSFTVKHDNGEEEIIERVYNARKLFDLLAEQNHDFAEPKKNWALIR